MKNVYRSLIAATGGLFLVSCSTSSIDYTVPDSLCEAEIGDAIPVEFFPPGEEIETIKSAHPGSGSCFSMVDGEVFFKSEETEQDGTLERSLLRFDPEEDHDREGDPEEVISGDFTVHAWPELAAVTTQCTTHKSVQRTYLLMVGIHPPDDLDNAQKILTDYALTAAQNNFNRITYCQESDAYPEEEEE